jgi:hypothetical protein
MNRVGGVLAGEAHTPVTDPQTPFFSVDVEAANVPARRLGTQPG